MSRVRIDFDERGAIVEHELWPADDYASRVWKAMMLSPSIEVCGALLRGESVPVDRLDPEWVERFERRP